MKKGFYLKFHNTIDNKKNLIPSWERKQVTYKIQENRNNTKAQKKAEGKVYLTMTINRSVLRVDYRHFQMQLFEDMLKLSKEQKHKR